ncbi:hypothetical protein HZB01_01555 [Candidatus Woesearchaeota archaeon]|nr:hypothetical protein [Candidatus Woesearchaeota archaeon]
MGAFELADLERILGEPKQLPVVSTPPPQLPAQRVPALEVTTLYCVDEFVGDSLDLILTPHLVRDGVGRFSPRDLFVPLLFQKYGPVIAAFIDKIYVPEQEFVVRYPLGRDGPAKDFLQYGRLTEIRTAFLREQIEQIIHPSPGVVDIHKEELTLPSPPEPIDYSTPKTVSSGSDSPFAFLSPLSSAVTLEDFHDFVRHYGVLPYIDIAARSSLELETAIMQLTSGELAGKKHAPESFYHVYSEFVYESLHGTTVGRDRKHTTYHARLAKDAFSGQWVASIEPIPEIHHANVYGLATPQNLHEHKGTSFEIHVPFHASIKEGHYLAFRRVLLRLSAELLRQGYTTRVLQPTEPFFFNPQEIMGEEITACIPRINYAIAEGLPGRLTKRDPLVSEDTNIILEAVVDAPLGKVTYAVRDAKKEGYYISVRGAGFGFLSIDGKAVSSKVLEGLPGIRKIAYGINNATEQEYHLLWVPNEADPKTHFAEAAKGMLSPFFEGKKQHAFFRTDGRKLEGFYHQLVSSVEREMGLRLLSPRDYAREHHLPPEDLQALVAQHEVLDGIFAVPLEKLGIQTKKYEPIPLYSVKEALALLEKYHDFFPSTATERNLRLHFEYVASNSSLSLPQRMQTTLEEVTSFFRAMEQGVSLQGIYAKGIDSFAMSIASTIAASTPFNTSYDPTSKCLRVGDSTLEMSYGLHSLLAETLQQEFAAISSGMQIDAYALVDAFFFKKDNFPEIVNSGKYPLENLTAAYLLLWGRTQEAKQLIASKQSSENVPVVVTSPGKETPPVSHAVDMGTQSQGIISRLLPHIRQKLDACRGEDVGHLYDAHTNSFPLFTLESSGVPSIQVSIGPEAFASYVHQYALAPPEKGVGSGYRDEMLYTWGAKLTYQKKIPLTELCRLFAIDNAYGALLTEVKAAVEANKDELLAASNGRIGTLYGNDMHFKGEKRNGNFYITTASIKTDDLSQDVFNAYKQLFQSVHGTAITREVIQGKKDVVHRRPASGLVS